MDAELVGGDQRLARRPGQQLSVAMPHVAAAQMVEALSAYKALQQGLDQAMPDQIMDLDGKKFRKKGYWRAIAVAFNLDVRFVSETRQTAGRFIDGRDNFGYVVLYEAEHANGRKETGDGACFAVEKARRFKCPHLVEGRPGWTEHFPHNTCPSFDPDFQWRALPGDATDHNVRSHAHTRAFNRAVSNLVGFGEVSAEEVEREQNEQASNAASSSTSKPASSQSTNGGTTSAATKSSHDGATKVVDFAIKTKADEGKKKGWVKYAVKFEDGREASTFDKELQTEIARLKKAGEVSGETCRPIIEKEVKGDKTFYNLKGFQTAAPTVVTEPPHPPDEPVDGPEKVLTVRKVSTDKGDRWVIQTDKRQLVTDVEKFATDSVHARTDKRGVLPVFDIIKTGEHTSVNKLKSLSIVDLSGSAPATEQQTSMDLASDTDEEGAGS